MSDALKPTRCIVDRAVLEELLRVAAANEKVDSDNSDRLTQLAGEVERGERVELYADAYPWEQPIPSRFRFETRPNGTGVWVPWTRQDRAAGVK